MQTSFIFLLEVMVTKPRALKKVILRIQLLKSAAGRAFTNDHQSFVHIKEDPSIVRSYDKPGDLSSPVSSQQRTSRLCTFEGGCNKFSQGRSRLCIKHGGGRPCEYPDCSKSAQGSAAFCIRHGVGIRCRIPGCKTSARGSDALCVSHGGGLKCIYGGGCSKSAQRPSDYCISHGGGKRCALPGCNRPVRGSLGKLCQEHSGGLAFQSDGHPMWNFYIIRFIFAN